MGEFYHGYSDLLAYEIRILGLKGTQAVGVPVQAYQGVFPNSIPCLKRQLRLNALLSYPDDFTQMVGTNIPVFEAKRESFCLIKLSEK